MLPSEVQKLVQIEGLIRLRPKIVAALARIDGSPQVTAVSPVSHGVLGASQEEFQDVIAEDLLEAAVAAEKAIKEKEKYQQGGSGSSAAKGESQTGTSPDATLTGGDRLDESGKPQIGIDPVVTPGGENATGGATEQSLPEPGNGKNNEVYGAPPGRLDETVGSRAPSSVIAPGAATIAGEFSSMERASPHGESIAGGDKKNDGTALSREQEELSATLPLTAAETVEGCENLC